MRTLLLSMQIAVSSPPPFDPAVSEVVVTARPVADLQRDLDQCVARRCPPKQDIEQSLALAEAQFVGGDYQASRRTLLASRRRNAGYAAELPVEVSTLHRANERLADLNGLVTAERVASFDAIDALKIGLDRNDAQVLVARVEVGDMYARQGRFDDAMDRYRTVAVQARRNHLPAVEGMALFHKAALLDAAASVAPSYRAAARQAANAVERTTDPRLAPFRNGVRLMRLSLVGDKDRAAAVASVMAQLEPVDSDRPLLAYSPSIDPAMLVTAAPGDADTQWVDVGFTVAPDGKVKNARMLRSSDQIDRRWASEAVRLVKERRYMPRIDQRGADDVGNVARFSFVHDIVVHTGSHMAARSNKARVAVTELTAVSEAKGSVIQ